MAKLINILAKFEKEGKIKVSTMKDPTPYSSYEKMYLKRKIFEKANYSAGYFSRRKILK